MGSDFVGTAVSCKFLNWEFNSELNYQHQICPGKNGNDRSERPLSLLPFIGMGMPIINYLSHILGKCDNMEDPLRFDIVPAGKLL